MKRKLKYIVPIAALALTGAFYQLVLTAPAESDTKVHGHVYVLPKEFLVNLAEGRYAKLTVALVLDEGQAIGGGEETPPPEGFGPLAQEPLVREIVTNTLTGGSAESLTSAGGRHEYERRIERAISKDTDVAASSVLFTDLVVQ